MANPVLAINRCGGIYSVAAKTMFAMDHHFLNNLTSTKQKRAALICRRRFITAGINNQVHQYFTVFSPGARTNTSSVCGTALRYRHTAYEREEAAAEHNEERRRTAGAPEAGGEGGGKAKY